MKSFTLKLEFVDQFHASFKSNPYSDCDVLAPVFATQSVETVSCWSSSPTHASFPFPLLTASHRLGEVFTQEGNRRNWAPSVTISILYDEEHQLVDSQRQERSSYVRLNAERTFVGYQQPEKTLRHVDYQVSAEHDRILWALLVKSVIQSWNFKSSCIYHLFHQLSFSFWVSIELTDFVIYWA